MAQGWEADAGPVTVEFTNGQKVEAGFKVAPKAMKAASRKTNAKLGREVRGWIRSATSGASRQQRRMRGGIGSSATSTEVRTTISNTAGAPGAMGAFLGAKKYPQFPAAIAPGWTVAGPGGPLVVNPTLHKHEDDIETLHLQGQLDALASALPKF